MLYKIEFDDNGKLITKNRVDQLWISKTKEDAYKVLFKRDKAIPYIVEYLWETQEAAAKWARHCLRNVKDKIQIKEVKDSEGSVYRIEYYYESQLLAITEQTGLIIDECHNKDW